MYKLFDWSSVKSAFGGPSWWKLQTLWNWFLSPTLLSLCEFTLLVSIKGLSLPHSFLSKHFIFWKCLFFFLHQETMQFDHIWRQWCRRKMTSSMTGLEATELHFTMLLCKYMRASEYLPIKLQQGRCMPCTVGLLSSLMWPLFSRMILFNPFFCLVYVTARSF